MTAKRETSKTTTDSTDTFEVLTENVHGRRTVHRVDATDAAAAEQQVSEHLPDGTKVLDVDKAGRGVGSGDRDTPGGGVES